MRDLFIITEKFDSRKCYLSVRKNPESTAKTDTKAILSNLNHFYTEESEDPISNRFDSFANRSKRKKDKTSI